MFVVAQTYALAALLMCSATQATDWEVGLNRLGALSLGLERGVEVVARFKYQPVSEAEIAASELYVAEIGGFPLRSVRSHCDILLAMEGQAKGHSRSSRVLFNGSRLFAESRQMSARGKLLIRYFWRTDKEAASSYDIFSADGKRSQTPLERWRCSGNTFVDLPSDLGLLVRDLEPLVGIVATAAEHGFDPAYPSEEAGSLTLSVGDLRGLPSSHGNYYGCESLCDRVEVSWEAGASAVAIAWKGADYKPLVSQTLSWVDGFLASYSVTLHTPGSGRAFGERSYSLAVARRAIDSALLDSPPSTAIIRDLRFFEPVVYETASVSLTDEQVEQTSLRKVLERAVYEHAGGQVARTVSAVLPTGGMEEIDLLLGSVPVQVGVVPATTVLPVTSVGTRFPFVIEIHNLSDADLTLGRVSADCGCTEARVGSPLLPAHGVVELTGFMEVQSVGQSTKTIRVAISVEGEDDTRDLELSVQVTGLPALYTGGEAAFDIGLLPVGQSGYAELPAMHMGCASEEAPPVLTVTGGSVVGGNWQLEGEVIRGRVEVLVSPKVPLGAFVMPFAMRGPMCPSSASAGAFYGTLRPDSGEFTSWPECWVVLGGTRRSHILAFPSDIDITLPPPSEEDSGLILCSLGESPGEIVLRLPELGSSPGFTLPIVETLRFDCTLGPVEVRVVIAN
jgi:hypothetical protein